MSARRDAVLAAVILLLGGFGVPAGGAAVDFSPARAHLQAGRYQAAVASVRGELATSGSHAVETVEGWALLGEALAETGEYAAALEALDRGASVPRAAVAAGRIELLLGRVAAGRARLEAVLEGAQGAGDAEHLLARGDAARLLAPRDPTLYRVALDLYEAAARRMPGDPRPRVALGDLLLERYNNEEALEAYTAALELDGEFVPALFGLARSQDFDHLPSAVEVAERCLALQPSLVAAHVFVARRHVELEAYDEAERQLARALEVNPNAPDALTLKAALHFLREEPGEHAATVARVRAIAPGYDALYVTLAEVAEQNRRYRAAAGFAEEGARAHPETWAAHAASGRNRLRLGDMSAGRQALEQAFRGDPFDVWTKNTLDLLDRVERFDTASSRHFVVVTDPEETVVLAPRVLDLAEEAFAFFTERYRHRPPTPIRIEIYPRHADFSVRTLGLTGVDIVGVSFGPVIALDSPSAKTFGRFNWGSAVWHEIAHTFHLDRSRGRVPRWFTEGLAVHEERHARTGWGADVSPSFLGAFAAGRLPPLSRLNEAFLRPEYPEQIPHAYYLASLMMAFIEERDGFGVIARFLEGFGRGVGLDELVGTELGLTPAALDQAFVDFVRRRYSHALAALAGSTADGAEPGSGFTALLAEGRGKLASGEPFAAIDALEAARARFPEHAGGGSAYRLLARAYEEVGAWERAIDMLRRNIDIDADDFEGHEELARLLAASGAAEEAAEVLERALFIDPFRPHVHEALASGYEAREAWRDAIRARRALVSLNPPDPSAARYRLASALRHAGDLIEARREILGVLENAPMYRDALELLMQVRDGLGTPPEPRRGSQG